MTSAPGPMTTTALKTPVETDPAGGTPSHTAGESTEHESLEGVRARAWALLARGVKDRRAPFHQPALATVDALGWPTARTVTLRGVDPVARAVWCHSDVRSAKVSEIDAADGRAAFLFYDKPGKTQIRLSGRTVIHRQDTPARTGWARTNTFSRRCYLAPQAPGTRSPQATSGLPAGLETAEPSLEDSDIGWDNFCVVRMTVDRFDWLYLAVTGHRRAGFTWQDVAWIGTWLTP